jgi:hypothetical protein
MESPLPGLNIVIHYNQDAVIEIDSFSDMIYVYIKREKTDACYPTSCRN